MADSTPEDPTLETDDVVVLPPSDVIAYNEQRSCADIFRLAHEKQLTLDPDFQRNEVWNNAVKTRFIDSLAKQLPIPSMCFSIDSNTSERIVIDGLQRTIAITNFLDEKNEWTLSNIEDVDEKLRGKTNLYIRDNLPQVWATIKNVMIPITIIRCDYSSYDHMEYLYMIFHRLNTNSIRLTNQEIRNCIYSGPLNVSLKLSAKNPSIVSVFGASKRFSTEEYLLRQLAFGASLTTYSGRMAKYLNDFMFAHREETQESQINKINRAAKLIHDNFYDAAGYGKLSRTAIEGVVYGVMKNIDNLEGLKKTELLQRFAQFNKLEEFKADALSEGLSSKSKVITRLKAADKAFKAA